MILNTMINFLFFLMIFTTNTLLMLMLIITQGIMMFLNMTNFINSWLVVIVMLVYLGGVMMMFLYVNSIINVTSINTKNFVLLLIPSIFLTEKMSQSNILSMKMLSMNVHCYKEIYGFFLMSIVGVFIFFINKMLQFNSGTINNSL